MTSLAAGDLVVHVDHGIGRFVGLKTIEAAGAPHDCLEIHYAGGDKLYLPVENIDLLSRYGSEETGVELDRLGGAAWQARKARLKSRIREMAEELIKIAAERAAARGAAARRAEHGRLRRVLRPLPLRGDRRPADRDRRDARRSRRRPADGPADLRRRRLRQDRGGAARRLRRGDERQAGGGGRADHAARAPALQDLHRALPRLAGADRQASRLVAAAGARQTSRRASPTARSTSSIGTHALLGKAIKFKDLGLVDRRRGAALRRQAQGAAEGSCAPTCTC